jgi:hypothetical protein
MEGTNSASVGPGAKNPDAVLIDVEVEDRSPSFVDGECCHCGNCPDPGLCGDSPSKGVSCHGECGWPCQNSRTSERVGRGESHLLILPTKSRTKRARPLTL